MRSSPVNNQTVFECKYELDSLCGFLKLSRSYYGATKDVSFMNADCAYPICCAHSCVFPDINWKPNP